MTERVLVARLDSDGDVLLAGPAIRAMAAGRDGSPAEVILLCGPSGAQAARLLPGVSRIIQWRCPWIDAAPEPVDNAQTVRLIRELRRLRLDAAVILTSFHQSALPLALLLRQAGVATIAAISADYAGTLLDVRLRPDQDFDDDLPEPERALTVAAAVGFALPPGDDGRPRVHPPPDVSHLLDPSYRPYVVVHPGASVPARAWSPHRCAEAVDALAAAGRRVVVTGGPGERELTAYVAGSQGLDLGGRTDFAELAGVLAGAAALVVGNTGPAHLAAAVRTPVVSLFAPVVPARRWAPYGVRHILLGDQSAPCRASRARDCPITGHPCLDSVAPASVVAAVADLIGSSDPMPWVVPSALDPVLDSSAALARDRGTHAIGGC